MNKKHEDNSMWMPIGMCWGTALGLIFGTIFDNVVMGLCFGPSLGLLFGTVISGFHSKNDDK